MGDALSLDAAWTGVMIEYDEQDWPGAPVYKRAVPGWQCTACDARLGAAGLPPRACPKCGQRWRDGDG